MGAQRACVQTHFWQVLLYLKFLLLFLIILKTSAKFSGCFTNRQSIVGVRSKVLHNKN